MPSCSTAGPTGIVGPTTDSTAPAVLFRSTLNHPLMKKQTTPLVHLDTPDDALTASPARSAPPKRPGPLQINHPNNPKTQLQGGSLLQAPPC